MDDDISEVDDGKSNDECEEAIRQFAEITETDEAFAHSMLQDVNYDLDLALTKFFSGEGANNDGDDSSNRAKSPQPPKKRARREESQFPAEITVVSWNVDGLDRGEIHTRFTAVLVSIAKINPEVIYLQEMTNEVMPQLTELMEKMYHIFVSNPNFPYYCVTLVSKNIEIRSNEVMEFAKTGMGRSAIIVHAQWQKLKLKLVNTHLESLKEESETRTAQFGQCMKKLGELATEDEPNTLAIFGGDLNIRDSEVNGVPNNVKDAWIAAGSKMENKFTWDMRKNDNKKLPSGVRCRFDRLYYSGPYAKLDFTLHGTQRIRRVHCFPSDHFGICCRFYNPPGLLPA